MNEKLFAILMFIIVFSVVMFVGYEVVTKEVLALNEECLRQAGINMTQIMKSCNITSLA